MSGFEQYVECQWCHAHNPTTVRTCDRCGAPLDLKNLVSDSGWRQAPRLADLTEIHWSASVCQLEGEIVPVTEVDLDPGDSIFFEHHAMLWKDETVGMSVMSSPGGAKRVLAGLPFVLSVARGPGRVACSRDAPGELVVLPIDPGVELDVREHAMVWATSTLTYTFERIQGLRTILAAGSGMYLDRFVAQQAPGLVVLHGYGNVFERTLADGESLQLEPGGFLYKDASVRMEVQTVSLNAEAPGAATTEGEAGAAEPERRGLRGLKAAKSLGRGGLQAVASLRSGGGLQGAAAGLMGGSGITLMRVIGPGRVGIQSMYQHAHTE